MKRIRTSTLGLALVVAVLWARVLMAAQDESAGSAEGPAIMQPYAGDPEAARELDGQATAAYEAGRVAEAAVLFQQAWEAYQHPHFQYNIGQCHRAAGQWEQAASAYRQRLELEPAPDSIIYIHLGRCLLQMDRRDEAEAAFLRYIRLEPGTAEATSARHAIIGGRWLDDRSDRGAATLVQANEVHERAIALVERDQMDEAARLYVEGYEQLSDIHEFLLNAGLCFLEAQEASEATRMFLRYLGTPGADAEAWVHLGASLRAMDDLAGALEAYESYLDEAPRGEFADKAQQVARSIRRYEGLPPREEEQAADQIPAVVGRARSGVGTWRTTGEITTPLGRRAASLGEGMSSRHARYNLAFYHMRRQEWEQALPCLEEALQVAGNEPGYAAAHLDAAECLLQLDRQTEATEHIRIYLRRADEEELPNEQNDRRRAEDLRQRCAQSSGSSRGTNPDARSQVTDLARDSRRHTHAETHGICRRPDRSRRLG